MNTKLDKPNRLARLSVLVGAALIGLSFASAPTSYAGTGDNYGWWQTWAGLKVSTYHEVGNGDVRVRFLDQNGDDFRGWVFHGNPVCSSSPWLVISRDHPERIGMFKTTMAAGLSQRTVYVLVEPVNGICYLKQIRLEYRAPN